MSNVFPTMQSVDYDECGEVRVPTRFDPEGGLTKRELFAAMAMQGFAAHPGGPNLGKDAAELAVKWADRLLAELAKSPPDAVGFPP